MEELKIGRLRIAPYGITEVSFDGEGHTFVPREEILAVRVVARGRTSENPAIAITIGALLGAVAVATFVFWWVKGDDGLASTRRVRAVAPDAVVAVVTAHRDPDWVVRATQAGACAFIPKDGSLTEMLDVLRRARPGQMLIAPSTFATTAPRVRPPDAAQRPVLTRREQEVLDCLGRGMPVKSVARVLGITLDTCRGYVKSLHAKLGVRSQLEAVIKAQELGLLSPSRVH